VLLVRKSLERARQESPLTDIRPFPSSKEFAAVIPESARRIGMTFDAAPVQQLNFYSKLLSGREFVDISPLNRDIRSVKSGFEIEQIKISGTCLSSIFTQVPEFLKAGMRELDLSAEFEYRCVRRVMKAMCVCVPLIRNFPKDLPFLPAHPVTVF